MHGAAWLLCTTLSIFLLFAAPRHGAAFVVKGAVASIVAAIILVVMLGLILRGFAFRPSAAFTTALFQLLMTIVVIAMLNIMNILFRGMVDVQIAFHQRRNAANLHRFPISFVVAHRQQLKTLGTLMWCFGAGLMLYGVWFDMQV